MRYIKIRFLEWRQAGETSDQRAASATLNELRADHEGRITAVQRLEEQAKNERRELTPEEATERQRLNTEVNQILEKIGLLEARYKAGTDARRDTNRIGTFGYQEIDDTGNLVRLTDDEGNPVPRNIVVGYEVVDDAPPAPSWATSQPAARTVRT